MCKFLFPAKNVNQVQTLTSTFACTVTIENQNIIVHGCKVLTHFESLGHKTFSWKSSYKDIHAHLRGIEFLILLMKHNDKVTYIAGITNWHLKLDSSEN